MTEYGDPGAGIVLIRPVGRHDEASVEDEIKIIRTNTGMEFKVLSFTVEDWNRDLSPWEAPPAFGKEGFGGLAARTLGEILKYCGDRSLKYYIGGYSLAGLFALWAAYQTDVFDGVAATSPSMWFPGFSEYMSDNGIGCDKVYLSLGNREEKTRNPIMSTVGDRIRDSYVALKESGVNCILEWNEGNHFTDPVIRTAKAFSWILTA
ncbi:MAG: esterase [Lachnospiraceae bacterium]|nr:esterase [Lachnospiraceae bacterium]